MPDAIYSKHVLQKFERFNSFMLFKWVFPSFLAVATHKLLWWWLDKKSIRLGGCSCEVITACVCLLAVDLVSVKFPFLCDFCDWDNTVCSTLLGLTSSGKGMAASHHVSVFQRNDFSVLCHRNKGSARLCCKSATLPPFSSLIQSPGLSDSGLGT